MNRSRTARGHATRARLLAAAESVFGEKGYHDASVHEITVAAGMGQGTFYFYFSGKLELFRALLMDLARQLREVTSEATGRAVSRLEAERLALGAFFAFAQSHRHLYRLIRTADLVEPGLGRQYYESFVKAYTHVLQRAQQTGELRPLDPESVAWCLIGVAEALHMRWMEWEGIEPPPHVMDAVMAMISHGIGPAEASAHKWR